MSERRRGLGRGLGALIPSGPPQSTEGTNRPRDVFFNASPSPAAADTSDEEAGSADAASRSGVSRETPEAAATDDSQLVEVPGAHFAELPVGTVTPNPRQPRQVFDEDDLAELTHSISELGVLQPIVVRPLAADLVDAELTGLPGTEGPVRYELIMGERRLRASIQAGQPTIPAIIRETADEDLLRDALLENLHRSQLNPLEEAAAYQQLLEDFGCTHEELARRIGRSRPQISNMVRLLRLPPLVQRRVAAGVLSAGHARALLGLTDGAGMERLAQRIVAEGLSVRAVEEIVLLDDDTATPERPSKRGSTARELDPALHDAAGRLSDRLDTTVTIVMGRRKGKLSIDFASREDLERILDVLDG